MKLATILSPEGARQTAILEDDRAFVTDIPGIDHAILNGIAVDEAPGTWLPIERLRFDVPLRPPILLCTGNNYRDHNDERTRIDTQRMEFFIKAGQTISGIDEPLRWKPSLTRKLDQETELGIVIGVAGSDISEESARDHIFGFVIVNDVTARDRQVRSQPDGSFVMDLGSSKNFDGSTRLNRSVVTIDEIGDPQALQLETLVNGSHRQRNNTRNMILGIDRIVSEFSRIMTLTPGMIISTGTPGGTGWGQDAALGGNGKIPEGCVEGAYLAPGDEVESRIEGMDPLLFSVSRH